MIRPPAQYTLKHYAEGSELTMTFSAHTDLPTLREHLMNFLKAVGWAESSVEELFNLEEK